MYISGMCRTQLVDAWLERFGGCDIDAAGCEHSKNVAPSCPSLHAPCENTSPLDLVMRAFPVNTTPILTPDVSTHRGQRAERVERERQWAFFLLLHCALAARSVSVAVCLRRRGGASAAGAVSAAVCPEKERPRKRSAEGRSEQTLPPETNPSSSLCAAVSARYRLSN